jgi:glutamate/tyrosine decarboxylase-like PLP-dependent enzyme
MEGNSRDILMLKQESSLSLRRVITVWMSIRFVKISTKTRSVILNVMKLTVGIFVILGSTYTGHYEPVLEVSNLLDKYQEETGLDICIHVDGASGAMFSPFATPSVKFGFEIPRVQSINTYLPKLTYLISDLDINMVLLMRVSAGLFSVTKTYFPNI